MISCIKKYPYSQKSNQLSEIKGRVIVTVSYLVNG